MFTAPPPELQALLLGIPSALTRFNAWAVEVGGQKYFEKGKNAPPFVRGFNTEFHLDCRRVGCWGFPPYFRVWFLNHLPSNQSMSYNTRDGSTVQGERGTL
jgi:hypothetical protein